MSDQKPDVVEIFPGPFQITRQQAALQQIDMAVEMFRNGNWAASITLAGAAETQMPDPPDPFVFKAIVDRFGGKTAKQLNAIRDWLKHSGGDKPEAIDLHEADAVMSLLRAISKFAVLYGEWSGRWRSLTRGEAKDVCRCPNESPVTLTRGRPRTEKPSVAGRTDLIFEITKSSRAPFVVL